MDSYLTLMGEGEGYYEEKRSKFFGRCKNVTEKDEAVAYINDVKSRFRDASHNVGAYSIRAGNLTHSSDDGEPSGTAGLPALDVLRKGGIVDAVVVVTRYFGGTELGKGGLVRAYTAAASDAVKNAGVARMTLCCEYLLTVDYPQYELLLKLLDSLSARVEGADFTDRVAVTVTLRKETEPQLLQAFSELTKNASTPRLLKELYDPFTKV